MYLSCCRLHMRRVRYYKVCDYKKGNKTTQRHLPICQCHQRPDCQNKVSWNQVCVLARHIDRFSLPKFFNNGYRTRMLLWKKIYNFPEKSELPKFILPLKISWLIFCAVSGVEMKNLQRSGQAHYLISWLHCLISRSWLRCVLLCSSVSLLEGYQQV